MADYAATFRQSFHWDNVRRTGLTLAGNRRARRALIEGARTSAHAISETIDARLYFGWQHFARDRRPAVVNIDSAATFLAGPGGEPATRMVSCKRGHVFLRHAAAYIIARGLIFTVVTGAAFSNGASGAISFSLRIFLTSKVVRSPLGHQGWRTAPRHTPSRMGGDGLHECLLPELKAFDLIPNSGCR
jgi:hypothetical protein